MRPVSARLPNCALAFKLASCIVAAEAFCGARQLAPVFAARGHEVRLMSPEYVRGA